MKQKVIFAPFRGEFGYFIMHYIRFVHHYPAREKIVCCQEGDEVFFPSATGFIHDARFETPDAWRFRIGEQLSYGEEWIRELKPGYEPICMRGTLTHDEIISQRFCLTPRTHRNLRSDVVICPRHRHRSAQRNFGHWQYIVNRLRAHHLTVAAVGQKESSQALSDLQFCSYDYPDASAAIELLLNCRLYIGTDTGPSHLAAFLGRPMLVFRCEDRTTNYFPLMGRQTDKFCFVPRGWDKPETVATAALLFMERQGIPPHGVTNLAPGASQIE